MRELLKRLAPETELYPKQCFTAYRRALRKPVFRDDPMRYPPEAVAQGIIIESGRFAKEVVLGAYVQLQKENKHWPLLGADVVESVLRAGCQDALSDIPQQSKSRQGGTVSSAGLFSEYFFVFVTGLLFPKRSAELLLTLTQKQNARGLLLAASALNEGGSHSELSPDGFRKLVIVCHRLADIRNLRIRPEFLVRKPDWVCDCIRDKSIKSGEEYMFKNFEREREEQEDTIEKPEGMSDKKQFKAEQVACGEAHGHPGGEEDHPLSSSEGSGSTSRRSEDRERPALNFPNVEPVDPVVESVTGKRKPDGDEAIGEPQCATAKPEEDVPCKRPRPGAGRWACEVRPAQDDFSFPNNKKICDLLDVVHQYHQLNRDPFRTEGYQRAIARIRALDHEILTVDDVRELEESSGLSGGIVDKIIEIVQTGYLRQVDAILRSVDNSGMKELCQVWGIGPAKAGQLFRMGIKGVADLRRAVQDEPDLLTTMQMVGLKYYEDLLKRIPREDVAILERLIRGLAKQISPDLDAVAAGSYLRGKPDCGDIDVLVHGPSDQVRPAIQRIKKVLHKKGILTDDLVVGGDKYFGIFRLPGRPHGRLDLFAVPKEEYPFAILTFTGSAVFNRCVGFLNCTFLSRPRGEPCIIDDDMNVIFSSTYRSMRAKAKSMGYCLSQKGIQRVFRKHGVQVLMVSRQRTF